MDKISFQNNTKCIIYTPRRSDRAIRSMQFMHTDSLGNTKMASKTSSTFSTTATSSTVSSIQDKWVINLSKKELTPEEKSLLQKGPKFELTPAAIPAKEYILTTIVVALQAGELNGVDCSGLYHAVNRILKAYTNKPMHTNIMKAEHLALENLRKDKECIIVTADKV